MDVEEAGYIMMLGYALDGRTEMVRNALGHQSDEAIDQFYQAWILLGLGLSDEMARRARLEE